MVFRSGQLADSKNRDKESNTSPLHPLLGMDNCWQNPTVRRVVIESLVEEDRKDTCRSTEVVTSVGVKAVVMELVNCAR